MLKRKGSSRKERSTALAKYLTEKRLNRRLTQKEIAKRIKRSRSYICRIETGERERKSVPRKPLRGFILYQLAEAYKAPVAEILEKANWPQLLLLDTTKKERQQLIRHLGEIRQRKNKNR
jgi:transcriptional regulator with XRE-family HTH domain